MSTYIAQLNLIVNYKEKVSNTRIILMMMEYIPFPISIKVIVSRVIMPVAVEYLRI